MESYQYFEIYWKFLQYLGIYFPKTNRALFGIWSIFIQTVVTIYYPLSLVIGFFHLTELRDILENLSLIFTLIACSIKIIIFGIRRKQMTKIRELVCKLDLEIKSPEEVQCMEEHKQTTKKIMLTYASLYIFILISGGVGLLFHSERRLMYPAWFPIDWKTSLFNYRTILLYQFVGLTVLGIQNFINDSFPPAILCLLTGHMKVLNLRLQNIGADITQKQNHHRDLVNSILTHKVIVQFYENLHTLISIGAFIQVFVTAFNIGITIIAFLFNDQDLFHKLYFCSYLVAIPLQIFLMCYYGTVIQEQSKGFVTALFFNEWVPQSIAFKKDMIILMERFKRSFTFRACGITEISLDTFVAVMRSALSLFAVLLKLKP